ncbi:hypothetical protein FLP10_15930 [Agromyces intestinalis]|uniref:Uncharacterized protein n=1 Tax=Agromyces intestinalis TaxID=2592652 RepID=A0A5C1YJV7_9MICO|nr:hypothetical protein [Agromyces intestinalis]QEO15745.1 hypothetical protein FLP10_15930 [Agromyces intestinalis]
MLLRRPFLRWLFIAPVVLPLWMVVGWAIFGAGGWSTLGLVITLPAAFLALLVIALLVNARPSVRAERAVSWTDVGVLGAWHVLLIAAGCYGSTALLFGVLALIAAVAAFWVSIWQLVSDGARRMQASMAEFERLAGQGRPDASKRPPFDDGDGDVIIVNEVRD